MHAPLEEPSGRFFDSRSEEDTHELARLQLSGDGPTRGSMGSDLVSRTIIEEVRGHGALTRAQLAELLNLPKSTVSEHVRCLVRRGELVAGSTAAGPRRGRPAEVIMPAPQAAMCAVARLSHGSGAANGPVDVALLDSRGETRWHRRGAVGEPPLRAIERMVRSALGALSLTRADVARLVLVLPLPIAGPSGSREQVGFDDSRIDATVGDLGVRPHLRLEKTLKVPTELVNDADAAALGEALFGAGRGSDLAFIKAVRGLGMGMVSGGQLRRVPGASVGEIAHVRVPGNNSVCPCGSIGCWFAASYEGLGLAAMARSAGATATTFEALERACARRDAPSIAAVQTVGESIGQVLSSYYLFSLPPLTLLELSLGSTFEPLRDGLRQGIAAAAPHWVAGRSLSIEQGDLEDPELWGSLALAPVAS